MKSIKLLVFTFVTIVTFSCSEDDTTINHVVTIESNGGTNFASIVVPRGELLPQNKLSPNPIISDGGIFEYWTTDSELLIPFDFDSPITEPITLYAKWFYVTYTFNYIDGSSPIDEVQIRAGHLLERPENPVKEGYIFVDWYKDGEFSQVFDFDQPATEDTRIYGRWLQPSPESWFTVSSEGILTGCMPDSGTEVVVIPEKIEDVTIKGIGDWFVLANGITFVKEFILPETIETIGTGSFQSSEIRTITIPSKVKVLLPNSFKSCDHLTSFNFAPNSTLEKLQSSDGNESVISSSSLSTISFPPSLEYVGKYTLNGCSSLSQITFERSESPIVFYTSLPDGGHWLFGGYHPQTIRMPNQVKNAFFALNEPVMDPWEFEQWQEFVVGY